MGFVYYDHTDEQKKLFQEKVDKALSYISPDMSDLDKVLVLHDYLAQHCRYSHEERTHNVTAYGALVDEQAICEGYARAYLVLLRKAGIQAGMCTSIADMDHVWNVVKVDGKWYHVDPTWDDPSWNREGYVRHKYFMLSSAEIVNRGYSGWKESVNCTDTTYDSPYYWWNSVTSRIVYRDGKQYYLEYDSNTARSYLTERDGDRTKTIYPVSSYVKEEYGDEDVISPFAQLSAMGDYLYFNDEKMFTR